MPRQLVEVPVKTSLVEFGPAPLSVTFDAVETSEDDQLYVPAARETVCPAVQLESADCTAAGVAVEVSDAQIVVRAGMVPAPAFDHPAEG